MLAELRCDQFVDAGLPREPIVFSTGLNIILGSKSASNSIGKTTALLAIDYAFGGNAYTRSDGDVIEHVGPHKIKFAFRFSDVTFRFSRSTDLPDLVFPCDENYSPADPWCMSKYREWLLSQYEMNTLGGTFRDLISPFFRIYGKDNLDEREPLRASAKEPKEKSVARLLKLFDKYSQLRLLEEALRKTKEERNAFRTAQKYSYISAASNNKEMIENSARIHEYTEQREELARHQSKGLLDIDAATADLIASVKRNLSSLRRKRTRLQSKLASICDEKEIEPFRSTRTYSELTEFFPGANIRHIKEIEEFHKRLSRVLSKERKEAERDIRIEIEKINALIAAEEQRLKKIDNLPNASIASFEEYSAITKEIERLVDANNAYCKGEQLKANEQRCKSELEQESTRKLNDIEMTLNAELSRLNAIVYGEGKTAPRIIIPSRTKYDFSIPHDTGTGSKTRGMFLLDLSLLHLTALPAIAHDTVAIKQVQDDVVLRLLEQYSKEKKQIFLALDKAESLGDGKLPDVVERNTVLKLGPGHELFGRSWNQDKNDSQHVRTVQ